MEDNWRWRFDWSQVTDRATSRLYELCQLYDR
jgi:4-alpha-glucanotransferase